MRCLLVTLEYPPFYGGVANYYGHLVQAWPPEDEIVVIDNKEGQLLAPRGKWPWRRSFATLWRTLRQSHFDFLLVGQILPLGTVVWLLSFILPIKYGVFLHGMDWGEAVARPRKMWLAKRILGRSALVIAVNSYTAELIKRAQPSVSGRVVIVNPGIDNVSPPFIAPEYLASLRQRYNLDNCSILLTVGRVVERKGVDKVLEAMSQLLPYYPKLRYIIVGDGPYLKICKELAVDLGLNEAVIFITDADDNEKAAWYQLADIFVMASRSKGSDFEGFGIVYLEANQAGKPVIAGQSGGVRDAVVDGETGLMVDPQSSEAIAQAVRCLLDDESLRRRLGETGQARLSQFLWSRQARLLRNKIKEVL